MYISILSLLFIGGFIAYAIWQSNKGSKSDLDIINLLCAVGYIEKHLPDLKNIYPHIKGHECRYAFLLQYLQDAQNLKVSELNNKWQGIYNFFYSRTKFHQGSGAAISYTNYGRITPSTILHVADMYKANSVAIGNGVWEDSIDYCKQAGKEDLKKGDYYYPKSIDELVKVIETYDRNYIGHVQMEKR